MLRTGNSPPKSFSFQITIAMAFASLSITLIIGAILIAARVTEETSRTTSRRYTQQLVRQISNNIEYYIDYIYSVSSIVQANTDIQAYLDTDTKENPETDAETAQSVLNVMMNTRSDISLIIIFSYRGGFITSVRENKLNPFVKHSEQSWFVRAQEAKGSLTVSSSHVQNIIEDQYLWVISLSREIIDPNSGRGKGILLVDLNYRIIDRICSSVQLGKRGYIFIIDRSGDIVYHPQQQLLYSGLKTENIRKVLDEKENYFSGDDEDSDKFYTVEIMNSTGWKVVGVNYRSEFVENRDSIQRSYILLGLVFFTASIIMSILLSQRISKPIKELRRSMRDVEQGISDVTVDIHSSNEIGELGKAFNIMVGEIKKLLYRVTLEQEQKRKSELNALQMQINPHFLYNTLDSVIWMAERGKQQEVIAMTSALAKLFRISISKGKEIIDVISEIELVKNYLTIQKIRYRDRLDYRIEVDEDIKSFKTVKIILQPLVENAIYHGIKNNSSAGVVVISGYRTQKGIDLVVRDNGVGMREKTLEQIRKLLISDVPNTIEPAQRRGSGVGVRNVDERIKLHFGPDYGLEFESREEEGTTVFIHLPAISEEKEA